MIFEYLSFDSSQVRIDVKDSNLDTCLTIQNNLNNVIKIENYDFMEVFKILKAQFILDIVLCLLFERKIVIISDDVKNNAQMVEALIRLISPLTWTGTVISLLSSNMIDYLDAPFPFIACVTK